MPLIIFCVLSCSDLFSVEVIVNHEEDDFFVFSVMPSRDVYKHIFVHDTVLFMRVCV